MKNLRPLICFALFVISIMLLEWVGILQHLLSLVEEKEDNSVLFNGLIRMATVFIVGFIHSTKGEYINVICQLRCIDEKGFKIHSQVRSFYL